jgi:hypothetical protein
VEIRWYVVSNAQSACLERSLTFGFFAQQRRRYIHSVRKKGALGRQRQKGGRFAKVAPLTSSPDWSQRPNDPALGVESGAAAQIGSLVGPIAVTHTTLGDSAAPLSEPEHHDHAGESRGRIVGSLPESEGGGFEGFAIGLSSSSNPYASSEDHSALVATSPLRRRRDSIASEPRSEFDVRDLLVAEPFLHPHPVLSQPSITSDGEHRGKRMRLQDV